jgi:hypothetical protein
MYIILNIWHKGDDDDDKFKNHSDNPEQHNRKHEIKGNTKTAILGTAHILRKVLM